MNIKSLHYSVILSFIFLFLPVSAKEETKAKGAIDAKTFDQLTKAQELTEASQFFDALKVLNKVKNNSELNSYGRSQMWNFFAYIYAKQEKYNKAIEAYNNILKESDATDGLKTTAKYTLAQLYFQKEDYPSVIKFMNSWLKEIKKPTDTAYMMLAQAYYQTKDYDNSLTNLNNAIDALKNSGKKINENLYRMKAGIYFEKGDVANTLKTYEEMMQLFPKVSYLKQVAGLHGELGNNKKRLTTYDALYLNGQLKRESEILNLAYMYLGQEVPYKAGRIIEEGMQKGLIKSTSQNIETLANSWAQANEHKKAIPTLERAAKSSNKGLLYARLAGVHFDAGDFSAAAAAAKKAAQKGGLNRPDKNYLLLGMAYFNQKKYESALQAFRSAKKTKASFSDARQWESYTLSEIERIRLLEQTQQQLAEKTEKTLKADENNLDTMGKNLLNSDKK